MSLAVTLLGTGSPMPSPDRAGPATLISAGDGPDAEHYLASLDPDIEYRIAHHQDLDHRPPVTVIEVENGSVELPNGQGGAVTITCVQTDHKPVEPSVGFRFEFGSVSVAVAGDTVPCAGLDALCVGADHRTRRRPAPRRHHTPLTTRRK